MMATLPALHLRAVPRGAAGPSAPRGTALVTPAAVARVTVLAVVPPLHRDPLFRLGNALGIDKLQSAVYHLVGSNEAVAWAAARRVAIHLGDLTPRVRPTMRTGPAADQVLAVADEKGGDEIAAGGTFERHARSWCCPRGRAA